MNSIDDVHSTGQGSAPSKLGALPHAILNEVVVAMVLLSNAKAWPNEGRNGVVVDPESRFWCLPEINGQGKNRSVRFDAL